MVTMEIPPAYQWRGMQTSQTFKDVGFGPFIVQREQLRSKILEKADPETSYHINGCKAAGKTTLLHLLAQDLTNAGKEVWFFRTASLLDRSVYDLVEQKLVASEEDIYFLIDETQNNVNASVWSLLLKNDQGHNITTIGAGVPEFETLSWNFKRKIGTDELFMSNEKMLEDEGVVEYFSPQTATADQAAEIRKLLEHVRSYCGGHIYPLMWIAERLIPKIMNENKTANDLFTYLLDSQNFRMSDEFKDMQTRILPTIHQTDVSPLLYKNKDSALLHDLRKKGFCDNEDKIISQLLFESFISQVTPKQTSPFMLLNGGLDGVRQLLIYGLPLMSWDQYKPFGGPVEDALTFELYRILAGVKQLGTHLFNPRMVNQGNAARRPDLYLNSTIDAFVECVLTKANSKTEREKLDEHISRFYQNHSTGERHYQIGQRAFAILNYQEVGTEPLQPWDQRFQGPIFEQRVFTFLMSSKEVYLGSQLISSA